MGLKQTGGKAPPCSSHPLWLRCHSWCKQSLSIVFTPMAAWAAAIGRGYWIRGSSSKVWNGGGELTDHSSVVAPSPHWFAGTRAPDVKVRNIV